MDTFHHIFEHHITCHVEVLAKGVFKSYFQKSNLCGNAHLQQPRFATSSKISF